MLESPLFIVYLVGVALTFIIIGVNFGHALDDYYLKARLFSSAADRRARAKALLLVSPLLFIAPLLWPVTLGIVVTRALPLLLKDAFGKGRA